jgi:hypothetical protein
MKSQEVLEITNSSTFLTLFSNTVSVAFFNCGNLRTLVSIGTVVSMVTVELIVERTWVQLSQGNGAVIVFTSL